MVVSAVLKSARASVRARGWGWVGLLFFSSLSVVLTSARTSLRALGWVLLVVSAVLKSAWTSQVFGLGVGFLGRCVCGAEECPDQA